MKPIVRALEKVAPTNATVLLLGESGTGKEIAARALHLRSARANGPFVPLNCAAISENLVESELFGHERGAFTGATAARRGRLELADGGTLFLDEICELKAELQAKLLRVLQDQRFERVGGTRTIKVDVRWIAATNRDIEESVRSGMFREDLYHRLAVFPIQLPPLRERPKDVLPLAEMLLSRISGQLGRHALQLDDKAKQRLQEATWPGNIRELANVLERAAILTDGDTIHSKDLILSPSLQPGGSSGAKTIAAIEKNAIMDALAKVGGNRRKAADMLGLSVRTLYDKLKKYGIN